MFPQGTRRNQRKGSKKRKAVTFRDSEDEGFKDVYKGKKFCQLNDTYGHTTDECTTLKAVITKAKQKKGKPLEKKTRYTKHEVNIMVQKQVKKAIKKKRSLLKTYVHLGK